MHREYTEVPSHRHYYKLVHSPIQLISMFFCSQRNNQNHKRRKINLITKFLTANLRHLKICIPSKTHFSYSVWRLPYQESPFRSAFHLINVIKVPDIFSIITIVFSFLSFFILHSASFRVHREHE